MFVFPSLRGVLVGLGLTVGMLSPVAAETPRFEFAVGGALGIGPDYPGARSYGAGVGAQVQVHRLRLGRLTLAERDGWRERDGFGIAPALRVMGARKASDHPELAGTEDVSRAIELGVRVQYKTEAWQVFTTVRHGLRGHRGWVGEAGADGFLALGAQTTLGAGPRIGFGDGTFQRTYFGVPGNDGIGLKSVGLPGYTPGSGIHSAGLAVGLVHELSPEWAVFGGLTYDRLIGPARNSPVVAAGSRHQYGARIGIARKISLF